MKNNSSQRKKDNSDGSNENYLETRNIAGEDNKDEQMPVNVDNHSANFIVYCPNCKSTFDVSEQMIIWRDEFFEKVNKIVKDLKNEKI